MLFKLPIGAALPPLVTPGKGEVGELPAMATQAAAQPTSITLRVLKGRCSSYRYSKFWSRTNWHTACTLLQDGCSISTCRTVSATLPTVPGYPFSTRGCLRDFVRHDFDCTQVPLSQLRGLAFGQLILLTRSMASRIEQSWTAKAARNAAWAPKGIPPGGGIALCPLEHHQGLKRTTLPRLCLHTRCPTGDNTETKPRQGAISRALES